MRVARYLFIWTLLLVLVPAYLNAGSLQYQATTAVEAGMKDGSLAGEYDFYFSGSRAEPHTIIGVRKSVDFSHSLWQAMDVASQSVQQWYEYIDNQHRGVRDQYWGGEILDDQGHVVAIWYSKYRFRQAAFNEHGLLSIMRPVLKKNKIRTGVRPF